ncbi:hypothetical protein E2320_010876 [Naja naja]|nr:hypothetical protein E2320_010876 [Naja naja]
MTATDQSSPRLTSMTIFNFRISVTTLQCSKDISMICTYEQTIFKIKDGSVSSYISITCMGTFAESHKSESLHFGTQNGEGKTMRPVNFQDSFKHTLIVSASAILKILVDGFSDPHMKIMDNPKALCISICYSTPEESKSGSKVANVLKDLKLEVQEFIDRRAHLISESSKQYFSLDIHTGDILINDKTDACILTSQIVLDNPLESYNIEIVIEDINDNAPKFSKNEFEIEIPENAPTNMVLPLESADDEDLGENSIQNYTLSTNEYFWLHVQRNKDGIYSVDLVLKRSLDREKVSRLNITLMAVDGGVPQKTGTVQINIDILDINDNPPQFPQSEYKIKIKENLPRALQWLKWKLQILIWA